MKKKKMQISPEERELKQIKRLLILQLLKSKDITNKEIEIAMGIGLRNLSKIFPVKKIKRR